MAKTRGRHDHVFYWLTMLVAVMPATSERAVKQQRDEREDAGKFREHERSSFQSLNSLTTLAPQFINLGALGANVR